MDEHTLHHCCSLAFETLHTELTSKQTRAAEVVTHLRGLHYPLFVTLEKKPRSKKHTDANVLYDLRGCIGTFASEHLADGIQRYAIQAAFHDRRFHPLESSELKHLRIGVSLLTNFEPGVDVFDWEVGKHGIRIEFRDPVTGRHHSGTYLPEVCPAQGWSAEECLESLYRKAGFRQRLTKEVLAATKLERYQSAKKTMTYEEYALMYHN